MLAGGFTITASAYDRRGKGATATFAVGLAPDSVLHDAVRKTERLAVDRALTDVGRGIDQDALFDARRGSVTYPLERIRKLRKPLHGIRSAETAADAGGKTASAWSEYRAAYARWEAAHTLTLLLRAMHWLRPLPVGTVTVGFAASTLRSTTAATPAPPASRSLELLDPVCDRWMPGLYTEAEALQ